MGRRYKYTQEMRNWLKDNCKSGMTQQEITDMFNKKFKTSISKDSMQHLKKRIENEDNFKFPYVKNTGKYIKGHEGWLKNTKGIMKANKTSFKKGHNINCVPIGTETTRSNGYVYVKIKNPNIWKAKHYIIWENFYKKSIPKDCVIIFLDNDKTNFNINNLYLLNKKDYAKLNGKKLCSYNPEITKIGLLIVKLLKENEKINQKL